jgi:hypothetical protein
LIEVELMGEPQSDPVFFAPVLMRLFFGERRKRRREAFEVPVLNGVAELRLKFVAHTVTAGKDEKRR